MAETFHPPDALQIEVAASVNKQLPLGAQVNLFRVTHDDGQPDGSGIVYQYGPQRATVRTVGPIGPEDVSEIVEGVKGWITEMRFKARWTEDPGEAA